MRRHPLGGTGDSTGDDRERMVFVHGLEDSWRSWHPLAEALVVPHRLDAVDLPWRAGSSHRWHRDGSAGTWLAGALDQPGGRADVLVGHSLGANAVLELLCSTRPSPVRCAVLIAPFYWPPTAPVDWALFERSKRNFRELIHGALRLRLCHRVDAIGPDIVEAMGDKAFDRIGPLGFAAWFEHFVASGQLPLERISVPVLLIASHADLGLPDGRVAAFARRLQRVDTVILDAGRDHFCHVTCAKVTAEPIVDFVRSTTRAEHR